MAPPDTKKHPKRPRSSASSSQPEKNDAEELNETSIEVEIVDGTGKPLAKTMKTRKKEECPCQQSLGVYWLIKCSSTQCNQHWHTRCANLPGSLTEDIVNGLTDEGWLCPWCFVSSHPRPTNHPAAKNDMSILISSTASEICQAVKSNVSSDASILKQELNELYTAVSMDQKAVSSEICDALTSVKTLLEESKVLFKESSKSINTGQFPEESHNSTNNISSGCNTRETLPNEPSDIPPPQLGEPYSSLTNDVLDQETYTSTINFLVGEKAKFSDVNSSRKVLYFGEHGYKYSSSHHKASPIPNQIQALMDYLKAKDNGFKGNSVLVTCYESGENSCPAHKDDELWINPTSAIHTLSLGAERTMRFTSGDEGEQKDVKLPDNSLLTFTRKSQEHWKHAIIPEEEIIHPRFSITIRDVKPYYMNSTVIIGDSNTADLKFGPNKGSLGIWLPGERIKAGKVKDIPGPESLYPYRNMIIHTGLNNINNDQHAPIDSFVSTIDSKCKAIAQSYPKMRIYLSLLLPTKDRDLNCKVNKMNSLLSALVESRPYIKGKITHMNLVNHDGMLDEKFGRPNRTDNIHLGSLGIREFVKSLKACVIDRKSFRHNSNVTAQSRVSFGTVLNQPWSAPPWAPTQSAPPMPPQPHPLFPPAHPLGPPVSWPPLGLRSSQPPWHWPMPYPSPTSVRSSTERHNSSGMGSDTYRIGELQSNGYVPW